MDVGTVHSDKEFVGYNLSMLGYGYYGDLLQDSEKHRWMGPKRYDFSGKFRGSYSIIFFFKPTSGTVRYLGVKKFLRNRSYEGEFSFISCDSTSSPRDRLPCTHGFKQLESFPCTCINIIIQVFV